MPRLSQGLNIAKAGISTAKQPVYDAEKLVSPFTKLIDSAIEDAEIKQKEKAQQLDLDESTLDSLADKASLIDADEIDKSVQEIRDWEQDKIQSGVDITSLGYRTERRQKLANLQSQVAKSKSFSDFYTGAKETISNTEYLRKGPAFLRMQEEMGKPLSERDYTKAVNDIVGSSSMYDMDQYLTDVVENEKMVQDASTRQGKEFITDVEIQYQKPFYDLDPETGDLEMKMDQDWGLRTLSNMPEWALGSINEQVETNKEKYEGLEERVVGNDPNLTEEEILDWRLNGTTYTSGGTTEQKLDVLEKMMKSKAQHEVNVVSKVMRDRAPTSKQTDLAKQQAFLNQRTQAIAGGNVEAIVQELNSGTHGNKDEKAFEWRSLGNGIYEITYKKKDPLASMTGIDVYRDTSVKVNTKDPIETKRQLGQFYNIDVTEIRKEPPKPAPEDKKKKKIAGF
jgi:hypothetical protein